MSRSKSRGVCVALAVAAILLAVAPVSAQNTVNLAWQQFLAFANSWTGVQTFQNIVVNGTCTGCSGSGAPIGAPYLVQTATGVGSLTNYFRLVAGANVTLTPGTNTLTVASSGGGGSGCVPSGSAGQILSDSGSGACTSNATGTGILTALGVNVGSAGAPVLFGGALGTPSSATLTNATGLVTAGIVNAAVTLAKIQNAASNCVLVGSGAAGSGTAYTELTVGANLSCSGTTLNATGGGGGAVAAAYVSKTANYTAVWATDGTIEGKTNAFTITLPTAVGHAGFGFQVVNQQTANTVTVATTSAQTIDGNSTVGVVNGGSGFLSDGANWIIFSAAGLPLPSLSQGDIVIGSAANVPGTLAKSTATYAVLTNQGASNAPAYSTTLPLPFPYVFRPAVCQNATASLAFDTPTSAPAVAACITGSNTQQGVAQYAAASDLSVQGHFPLPSDQSGTIDFSDTWYGSPTTGVVVWTVSTICVDAGATGDPAFNTASTVSSTVAGTTNQFVHAAITGVTITGCGPSKEFYFKVERNAGSGSDTMSGTANLVSFSFIIRRTVTIGG